MLVKSKILRDTILLTAMQLLLDTSALLLNAFITRRLGASAIGILTLMQESFQTAMHFCARAVSFQRSLASPIQTLTVFFCTE